MFHGYTSDNHHQFTVIDVPAALPGCFIRKLKSTFLQAFVEQHKTAGFPAQHFDPVALFVDENKQITTHGVLFHLAGNNPAQPVKALAHIRRMSIEEIPSVVDGKHG